MTIQKVKEKIQPSDMSSSPATRRVKEQVVEYRTTLFTLDVWTNFSKYRILRCPLQLMQNQFSKL